MFRQLQRFAPYLLLGFLLLDSTYAFIQYFHQPLDGDLAWNVVPHEVVWNILQDPFGWGPLTEGTTYPNPNKFFTHILYRGYMLNMPIWLQAFVSPISSPYLAGAILKMGVHLSLVVLLTRAVLGPNWRRPVALLAIACLIIPFFQSGQFKGHIGIVDSAITYVFFYGLPTVFLLLLVLPFTDYFLHGKHTRLPTLKIILLGLFVPVVCLSGPLNPGAILVGIAVLGFAWVLRKLKDIPNQLLVILFLAGSFSLYSLYLGQYDSLTIDSRLPAWELYQKLPQGIWKHITTKLAWPVLLLGLAINYGLLRWQLPAEKIRLIFPWFLAFVGLYILLLPLGGFRGYRAGILRYDSILPVTLSLISLYALSSWALLRSFSKVNQKIYLVMLLIVAGIYTNADNFLAEEYYCEREALTTIAASKDVLVPLSGSCPVALWDTYPDASYSTLNGALFHHWRITDEIKQYSHPGSPKRD